MNRGYKNNQAPLVLNTLDLEDNSSVVSGDNLPIGMREANDDIGSCNFGTDRPLQGGRCIVGNGNCYAQFPHLQYVNTLTYSLNLILDNPTTTGLILGNYDGTSSADQDFRLYYQAALNQLRFEIQTVGGLESLYIDCSAYVNIPLRIVFNAVNSSYISVDINDDNYNKVITSNLISSASRPFHIGYSNVSLDSINIWDITINDIFLYKCDSLSTTTLYDSSGNNNHGTIQNYYAGLWGSQNEYSALDKLGYTESDGVTYFYDIAATQLIPIGELIPRDESDPTKCGAYLSNGTQADLQYKGAAPSRAVFKTSPCYNGSGSTYYSSLTPIVFGVSELRISFWFRYGGVTASTPGIMGTTNQNNISSNTGWNIYRNKGSSAISVSIGTTVSNAVTLGSQGDIFVQIVVIPGETIKVIKNGDEIDTGTICPPIVESTQPFYIGRHYLSNRCCVDTLWDVTVNGMRWPLSEPIIDPSNHTAFDVSGNGNHTTLINGSLVNEGKQDVFHYSQLGILNKTVDQVVPILDDLSVFADGTVLSDSNAILQDGKSFLNTGTELQVSNTPRVVEAERFNRFYTDSNDDVVNKEFDDFTGVILDQDFSDISESDIVKNIRKHSDELEGIQLITDTTLTNNN